MRNSETPDISERMYQELTYLRHKENNY